MSPARAASNALLREWGQSIMGEVLSIGSSTDEDGAGGHYRDYFPRASRYLTSEPAPYPGCDLVLDVRDLRSLHTDSLGTIFCSGVLEHVDDIYAAVRECYRVLAPGGTFLVGVPFQQPLHRAPQDFWRLTEFGLRFLLRPFATIEIQAIGDDPLFPVTYWARALKGPR